MFFKRLKLESVEGNVIFIFKSYFLLFIFVYVSKYFCDNFFLFFYVVSLIRNDFSL